LLYVYPTRAIQQGLKLEGWTIEDEEPQNVVISSSVTRFFLGSFASLPPQVFNVIGLFVSIGEFLVICHVASRWLPG
jgi:hypothetical protein